MLKKTLSLVLAAALALLSVPVSAQTYAPNTVWGAVPESLKPYVTSAVLQDASGHTTATVAIVDGRFTFLDVPPGGYTVVLNNAPGTALANSDPVTLPSDGVRQAIFPTTKSPGAVVSGKARGITTAGWIAIGAAAAGITTAIVAVSKNDKGNASSSR